MRHRPAGEAAEGCLPLVDLRSGRACRRPSRSRRSAERTDDRPRPLAARNHRRQGISPSTPPGERAGTTAPAKGLGKGRSAGSRPDAEASANGPASAPGRPVHPGRPTSPIGTAIRSRPRYIPPTGSSTPSTKPPSPNRRRPTGKTLATLRTNTNRIRGRAISVAQSRTTLAD